MENKPVKVGNIKGRLEDIQLWQADDVKALQEQLPAEPDPSSPAWIQWNVKKKMIEDAIKRLQDRQQLSDKPSGIQG